MSKSFTFIKFMLLSTSLSIVIICRDPVYGFNEIERIVSERELGNQNKIKRPGHITDQTNVSFMQNNHTEIESNGPGTQNNSPGTELPAPDCFGNAASRTILWIMSLFPHPPPHHMICLSCTGKTPAFLHHRSWRAYIRQRKCRAPVQGKGSRRPSQP